MKISNVLLPLFLVFFIFNTKAQIVNLNPDPNGDPWIAGGIPEVTPEIQEKSTLFLL